MTFVKHRVCGTELVWRRVTDYQEMPPFVLWCPACQCIVEKEEADRRGPFVAVTMKQEAP